MTVLFQLFMVHITLCSYDKGAYVLCGEESSVWVAYPGVLCMCSLGVAKLSEWAQGEAPGHISPLFYPVIIFCLILLAQ